jgi:hypothetical protein
MYWLKKTLSAEHDTIEEFARTLLGFYSILEEKGVARNVAIFPQNRNGSDYSYSVFFSPACIDYCPEFLKQISAEPCCQPESSDVSLLWGDLNTNSLLA